MRDLSSGSTTSPNPFLMPLEQRKPKTFWQQRPSTETRNVISLAVWTVGAALLFLAVIFCGGPK